MEKPHPEACVLCGESAARAPRIVVHQEHAHAATQDHALALCDAHGAELRAGRLTPQSIIYTWATRAHSALYQNERLVLRPELACLECNAALPGDVRDAGDVERDVTCAACGATNTLGSALGHRVAVRLRAMTR